MTEEYLRFSKVRLNDCPTGLFLHGETLAVMSEYSTLIRDGTFLQRDAYICSSGEYFVGGNVTPEERAELMVEPVDEYWITQHVLSCKEPIL